MRMCAGAQRERERAPAGCSGFLQGSWDRSVPEKALYGRPLEDGISHERGTGQRRCWRDLVRAVTEP